MMLHFHNAEKTDALDLILVNVANKYIGEKESRKQLFGKISAIDMHPKHILSFLKSAQTEN